ncbi:hypothetical protein WS71_00895 [Burkholderia mayonis]|uniref:Uncharacterized protein n=1 Tax=Burkholderia mayonis TaxID=1385591 RepID=A0A1B4FQU7_9BURK|nr:hypothetical protein WS71_00895 [Burkholderia mayonis]
MVERRVSSDCLRIGGVQQDHVDVGRDEVVDLREWPVQVVARGNRGDLRVRIDFLRLRCGVFHDDDEVRVAE